MFFVEKSPVLYSAIIYLSSKMKGKTGEKALLGKFEHWFMPDFGNLGRGNMAIERSVEQESSVS